MLCRYPTIAHDGDYYVVQLFERNDSIPKLMMYSMSWVSVLICMLICVISVLICLLLVGISCAASAGTTDSHVLLDRFKFSDYTSFAGIRPISVPVQAHCLWEGRR